MHDDGMGMVDYRQDLYPFVGSYVNLEGLAMHYLDEGQGDPVLMLHGNPTWSFYYRDLIPGLRDRHRVIVPDHIGCGLSDKPDDRHYDYSLARRVEDLGKLVDHLRLKEPITWVMHDWGGMIGMAYCCQHPERVKRLVLLNTAAFHLPKTKRLPPSLWLCRRTPLGRLLTCRLGLFSRLVLRWGCCRPLPERVREAYLTTCGSALNRVAHWRFVRDIPLAPNDPSYGLVSEVQDRLKMFDKTPALILWGEKDFVFDHHFLAEWRRRLPAAEVHTFPHAGHLVLEDAGKEILTRIRRFCEPTA